MTKATKGRKPDDDGVKVVAKNRRAVFDYAIEERVEAGLELMGSRGKVEQRGYTLVPISLYFKNGWAKVELGLGRGKTHEDRRDHIAERESRREIDRAMSLKKR